jgi:predicted RNase H-like HicB family nuclease
MPKYEVIIYWSAEDDSFIAEVPELPGCASDGKTYRQALANVEIIIRGMDRNRQRTKSPYPSTKGPSRLRLSAVKR